MLFGEVLDREQDGERRSQTDEAYYESEQDTFEYVFFEGSCLDPIEALVEVDAGARGGVAEKTYRDGRRAGLAP